MDAESTTDSPGHQDKKSGTAMDSECDKSDEESDTDSFVDAIEQLVIESVNDESEPVNTSRPNPLPGTDQGIHLNEAGECVNVCDDNKSEQRKLSLSEGERNSAADKFVEDALEGNETDSDTEGAPQKEQVVIDEEYLKKQEENMTDEDKEVKRKEAQEMKSNGNDKFKSGDYQDALVFYTDGLLLCPLCFKKERSIMYSNRAACKMKLEKNESAIDDCTKALEFNPVYLKALLRRAELYEKTDKLEDALADYGKAVEMDPSQHYARQCCMRLPDQIKERNEKMKEEMMGKLKELGNMVLKPFGLSTSNFNLQQDPNSGSYSVQFQQNQGQ